MKRASADDTVIFQVQWTDCNDFSCERKHIEANASCTWEFKDAEYYARRVRKYRQPKHIRIVVTTFQDLEYTSTPVLNDYLDIISEDELWWLPNTWEGIA